MSIVFHITTKKAYQDAQKQGLYLHPSLEHEGFIHCSRHYQVRDVALLHFKNQKELLLLAIDEAKSKSEIKYEGPSWDTFPHIYGPIHFDSVVQEFEFESGFDLPDEALNLVVHYSSQDAAESLYENAKHYDAMNGPGGADIDFYSEQARAKNGKVLELACGSGRLSIPIARQGLQVTGLDLSRSMLNQAKTKAQESGLQIQFQAGDIRQFRLAEKFEFIFCGFNSSQHLHEEREYRSFLDHVKKHLAANGTFAFDIFNPSISMLNRKPNERFLVSSYPDPDDGLEITVSEYPSYDSAKQLTSYRFIYEKGGKVIFEKQFSLRIYFPLEMDVLLRNAGFQIISKYGGYRLEPFESSCLKQIYLCRLL